MKYKRASIRLDLSGVYKFHLEELPWDREDIGETYNAMGFAHVYAHRSDEQALRLLRDHLIQAAAERIESLSKDIELLLRLK